MNAHTADAAHTLLNWILAPDTVRETQARDAAAELADIANGTGAEGLTGAQIRERWVIPNEVELSDYDFMELVAFGVKADSDGFEYAADDYPPRFKNPELARWVGSGYDRLYALYTSRTVEIARFWGRSDAQERYNAHISAS
ncbi:hypothetical protein NORO109296_26080 [Nocardiopsis rhodophaea]|uniref:hypothetical protein n=1 Tax=Nocardiopsis rhodophaea TaxID=280238 RepID=UPI0031DCE369